jgi:hypothetical protein
VNAEAVLNNDIAVADPPEVVARTIVIAATVWKPHIRYTAGRVATTAAWPRATR